MVVGFAFLMTIPLIIIFYQQSETLNIEITSAHMEKIASEIRDAADEVYYLGEPSKKTLSLYFPEGIHSITVINSRLAFLVEGPSGDYEVVKWTVANLTGSLQTYSGIHNIVVEAQDNDVSITD